MSVFLFHLKSRFQNIFSFIFYMKNSYFKLSFVSLDNNVELPDKFAMLMCSGSAGLLGGGKPVVRRGRKVTGPIMGCRFSLADRFHGGWPDCRLEYRMSRQSGGTKTT